MNSPQLIPPDVSAATAERDVPSGGSREQRGQGSRPWSAMFEGLFLLLPTRAIGALRGLIQIGPIEELVIVGRNSGFDRSVFVVLTRFGTIWYVGHPNGERAHWVRNLIAAGRATVVTRAGATAVTATLLVPGAERDLAIREHTRQQGLLPSRLLYRAARKHVTSTGAFFRLEPERAL